MRGFMTWWQSSMGRCGISWPPTRPLIPLAVLWLLGLVLLDHFSVPFLHPKIPDTYHSFLTHRDREVLEGMVVESPERTEEGLRVVVRVERLDQQTVPPLKARLTFSFVPSAGGFPEPGDLIVVTTRLKRPTHFRDPGVFDSRLALERKGILLSGFVSGPESYQVVKKSPTAFSKIFQPLRDKIRTLFYQSIHTDEAGFLTALLIGDRSGMSEELWEKFRRTGTSHLIAISGQHVGLVAMVCFVGFFWLLKRSEWFLLRFSARRMAGTAAILPVVFYTLLAGGPPSAIRALILVILIFLAPWVRRQVDPLVALALAAILITLLDPPAAFSASFQLSFLAVLGLLIFHRTATSQIEERRGQKFFRKYIENPFRMTLGATLLTTPLVAYRFHDVSLSGLLTNLWAIPYTGFLLVESAVTLLLSPIPLVGNWLWWALDVMTRGFLEALSVSERFSWVVSFYPTFFEMILAYGLIGGALLVIKIQKIRKVAMLSTAIFLLALIFPKFLPLTDRLEITFLDVGQGDAALVLSPDGHSLLVDGGGFLIPSEKRRGNDFNVGERVVVPFLKWRGVKKIDAILLSHPHPDHYGGLAAVLSHFPVGEFWWNGQNFPDATFDRLLSKLREDGIPMKVFHQDDRFEWHGLTVQVLYPHVIDPYRSINDNSLIVKMISGNMAVLFSGDVEKEGERSLAESGLLKANILKIPHHASRTSSSIPFIDGVFRGASFPMAVASLGEGNMFGFPHEGILEKYERRDVQVFRTDRNGAVIFQVPPDFPKTPVSIRRVSHNHE